MAAIPDIITERLAKGLQLTRNDLLEIETGLAMIEAPRRWEIEGLVLEGVANIVMDPDYLGDIKLEDLDYPEPDPGEVE
jgi:hypothetical protein